MSKKPKFATIVSGRLRQAFACPNCLHRLDGVTAAAFDRPFERLPDGRVKLKGWVTNCAYCWAVLVFSDDEGNVRVMTKEERASYKPDDYQRSIIEHMQKRYPGSDFTKKNFN